MWRKTSAVDDAIVSVNFVEWCPRDDNSRVVLQFPSPLTNEVVYFKTIFDLLRPEFLMLQYSVANSRHYAETLHKYDDRESYGVGRIFANTWIGDAKKQPLLRDDVTKLLIVFACCCSWLPSTWLRIFHSSTDDLLNRKNSARLRGAA